MRIWYGVDREHNPSYGLMTLFVESTNPDIDKIVIIMSNLIVVHKIGIECVYFGAGEVNIVDWNFLDRLYEISDSFKVVIESSEILPQYVINYFDAVILRLPVSRIADNVYIKYRTDISVGIIKASKFEVNSLYDLRNGQYSCDTEIYNDTED